MNIRCDFTQAGRIVAIAEINCRWEEEAIAKAHRLFARRKAERLDGFELWEKERLVCLFSIHSAKLVI